MKRLAFALILFGTSLLSSAAWARIGTDRDQDGGGVEPLRTTYTLDSLFFHGSGGTGDQDITPNETLTVTAVLSGGTWNATAPIDEFIIIPNTNDPPDAAGADLENYYSYLNSQASVISIGVNSSGKSRLTFNVAAPSTWQAGDLTFTIYLDGKCTSIHQAAVSETYVSLAEVNVMHAGTETLTGAGFTLGNMAADSTPPTLVTAGCYATSLTTLRIQVAESVSESGGDCGASFSVTGDGIAGSIVGSSLASSSSTVWTLTLASSLPDRDWQGTLTYDRDASAAELRDAAGNEMADGHNVTATTEKIAPANPTMTYPSATADLSGASIAWTGSANSSATDPSMAGVSLQGSLNGASWTTLSTDSDVTDGTYGATWTVGTQYNYYRLLAIDDLSNSAASSSSVDFQAKQRLVLSGSVSEAVNTFEDQATATITDAYGNAESGTHTLSLSKVSGAGTLTFSSEADGTPVITTLDIESASSGAFWLAGSAPGAYQVRAATAGLLADTLAVTIVTGAPNKVLVAMPGQSFVDGTGITGTPTATDAGTAFGINLYVVDASNYLCDFDTDNVGTVFGKTAVASPSGNNPQIKVGGAAYTTNWTTSKAVSFENGVNTTALLVKFYNASTTGAISATATGVANHPNSSDITINALDPDQMNFSLAAASQESGVAWTGTNTVSVKDVYQNLITWFNAADQPLTLDVTPQGAGVVTSFLITARGDAVLDEATDFVGGVCNLTALGITLTATPDAYDIGGDLGANQGTRVKNIIVNAPTLSSATPAWRTHINAEADSPGYMLQAAVDENGETLTVYWAFDNDSTKYSGYTVQNSASVTTGGGLLQKYLDGATINAQGAGYDYMFWWVGGTDSQGNTPDGKPISSNRLVYVVNPTLTVRGFDLGAGGLHPNTTNNTMTSLELTAEMAGAAITVTRLAFTKTSSSNATTTHISAFKLWLDVNGNDQYDAGTDTQLGSTLTGTVNPNFTGLSLMVPAGSPVRVLLTVDVSASATTAQNLGMEMVSESSVTLQNGVDDVVGHGGTWPQPGNAADWTLPVEFSVFSGTAGYGQNGLVWRTESEVNSLGFRVWRAETPEAGIHPALTAFTPLADWNQDEGLLGQENSSAGKDYRWQDTNIEPGVVYCYRLEAVDLDGSSEFHPESIYVSSLSKPTGFTLGTNTPNPFNPVTTLRFVLPEVLPVSLEVYNINGQLVRTLLSGQTLPWGPHQLLWDGTNNQGKQVASGVYIYRLSTPGFQQARTMQLLR
ncbi:MAG: FlgD immunoglobulin-like domain containing protein [Candidatus Delongbacteria bacterium]